MLTARIAAAAAAIGFVLVAGFQIALALGASWGNAAWGGRYDVLPRQLRIASAGAAVVLVIAAFVVLGRAGYWGAGVPFSVFRWGTWVLVPLLTLSALSNVASVSSWERFVLGPVALVLALLCLVVALGGIGQ